MHISLERTGGFTGRRLTSSLDTDDLPVDVAADATTALRALAAEPPPRPDHRSTEPRYRLTIADGATSRVVVVSEGRVTPSLRPIIEELIRRARSEAP